MSTPVKMGNVWFLPQLETRIIVMSPIVKNKRLTERANAFLLQNAGNCDIVLEGGFTLAPGQNQWFGNYNELNVMNVDIQINFQPATATSEPVVQRLEVMQVLTKFVGSGYWVNQPPMANVNTAPV